MAKPKFIMLGLTGALLVLSSLTRCHEFTEFQGNWILEPSKTSNLEKKQCTLVVEVEREMKKDNHSSMINGLIGKIVQFKSAPAAEAAAQDDADDSD